MLLREGTAPLAYWLSESAKTVRPRYPQAITAFFAAVLEINERIAHDGTAPQGARPGPYLQSAHRTFPCRHRSLAICLLHASQHPAHEIQIANIAGELGFNEISVSHEVAPISKIVPRGDTTVTDAYLNPVLRSYVASLACALNGSDLRAFTSSGGLVEAGQLRGKDSILSGPAGGVVGYARVARQQVTDEPSGLTWAEPAPMFPASMVTLKWNTKPRKPAYASQLPMLAIETVAAGGGSICRFDGVKLVVGPEGAGTNQGPHVTAGAVR